MINHGLSIYTSMEHSLLSLEHLALGLNSLDTLSDITIKVFAWCFFLYCKYFLIKITSLSFNYIIEIIVYIAFESSVIYLI